MPRIDRLWYEIDAETRGFDEGILQSGQRLKSFTEYAKGAPLAVLGAIGAAAIVAGSRMAQMAAVFEAEMQKIATVTGDASAGLAAFRKEVLELYRANPVQTTGELAQGLYDIVSAGVDAADAMGVLKVATDAAIGGVTGVNVAVDGITSALNAYRDIGLSATQVSDQMFEAVNKGKTTFGELSQSMGQTVAIAASVNVSLADVLAATAQLTLGGVKTAEAMTGIRSALVNILRPTDEFRQKYGELAKEFDASRLARDGFVKFLVDLQRESKGNSDVMRTLFSDVQGFAAVSGLMKDQGVGVVQMLRDVKDSAGATSTAAGIMKENTSALNQVLRNELSASLIELGEKLLPAVNAGLDLASRSLNRVAAQARDAAEAVKRLQSRGPLLGVQEQIATRRETAALRMDVAERGGEAFVGVSSEGLTRIRARVQAQRDMASANKELLETLNALIIARRKDEEQLAANQKAATEAAAKAAADSAKAAADAEAKRKADEARAAAMKAAAAEAKQLKVEFEDLIDRATPTLVDDMERALKRLADRAKGLVSDSELAKITALQRGLIDVQRSLEETERVIGGTKRIEEGDLLGALGGVESIDKQLANVRAQQQLTRDAGRQADLEKQINALVDRRAQLMKQLGPEWIKIEDVTEDTAARMRETARAIEAGARGALQLAEAFGIVDREAAAALESIAQIGANIPAALTGDFTSILSVAGGLAQLASSVLGRDDPQERERQELMRRNNEAIHALTLAIGDLGKNITGNEYTGLTGAVDSALRIDNGIARGASFLTALERLGLTMADVERVASELGITFDRNNLTQSLLDLQRALKQVELTRFAETFTGQMDALAASFDLLDISDPVEKMRELLKVFSDPKFGAPALSKALAGLDLTSPEGRAQAERVLQALFQQLRDGTLAAGALGDLTPQQLLDFIRQFEGLIDEANTGPGGTGGHNVDRAITEVTGSHLAGLLATGNVWAKQTAEATTAMLAQLRNAALPALLPPSLPAGTFGGTSIVISGLTINVSISGSASPAEATRVGETVGLAAADAIDRALASRLTAARRANGSILLT